MEKINEYGEVLKTFKMYLNLPNNDLSFGLSNTAQIYKKIISNSLKMIISASGMILINCTILNTTGNVGIGTHTINLHSTYNIYIYI